MQNQTHIRTLLFESLENTALQWIYAQMRPRHFRTGEFICREGEEGNSLFVIQSGTAQVMVGPLSGTRSQLARLRHGDVVGEMSLLTGEPRSATVVASMPTTALELTQETFAAIVAKYPVIVTNLGRILSRRLALTNARQAALQCRREAVALVVDQHGFRLVPAILAATKAASPHSVEMLDLTLTSTAEQNEWEQSGAEKLATLDGLLMAHPTVIVVADSHSQDLPFLLKQMDRAVAVVHESTAAGLAKIFEEIAEDTDLVLLTEDVAPGCDKSHLYGGRDKSDPYGGRDKSHPYGEIAGGKLTRVVRVCNLQRPGRDIAWLGRHLSRTKLGLALGAGGAKGYAHIAVLSALQRAGYEIDYVAGSSIGAMIGCWLAMGKHADAVEATMRDAFTPANVAATFKLSWSGMSTGYEVMTRICRETTANGSFADLVLPLTVMTADLNTRQPFTITEGPLWEALLAAVAIPGMFPPYQRAEQRLVDGLTLIPVPAQAVREAGADIVVSVNLISRELLPAWSGVRSSPVTNVRMLDTLLEVMDLAQMDASVRSAAFADVIVTPRFGPATWRDFHLADLFMTAGYAAVAEQLTTLHALARPQMTTC